METNPFSAERKTSERKRLWETIARNLVKRKSPKFKTSLSERSVRRRYMRITQGFKTKLSEEINACGISPEQSELDVLLEELMEREEERCQQGKKSEKDQEKAKDIRLKAMERLSQTKTRKSEEMTAPPKKSRRTSSEANSFLREKKRTRNGFQTKGTQIVEQGVRRRKKKVRRSKRKNTTV